MISIYKADTDYTDRRGHIRSGTRWVIRDHNGQRLTTTRTRKEAVETVKNNFGTDAKIHFGADGPGPEMLAKRFI